MRAVGEICGGNVMCFEGFLICRGVGLMTLIRGQNCGEISVSRDNGGRKKMRQLVAPGTRTSWTMGIWRSHRIAGKVVLECVKALLMCQETTRGADDESCGRMRIGRPCTVDAWGAVVNGTQFGSVRVQHGSLKEGSR